MRFRHCLFVASFLVAALAGACRDGAERAAGAQGVDGAQVDAASHPIGPDASWGGGGPIGDAGAAPGGELAIATWNIEEFPLDVTTPERVAEIILDLDLDLIAAQEIASEAAFELMVEGLEGYDAVLSHHEYEDGTYQKTGFIYRDSVLSITHISLPFRHEQPECFEEGTSFEPFPRPPLHVSFRALEADYEFTAINVHHKAFFPPCPNDCRERRACANRHLEDYVRDQVERFSPNVIVLGDFNEHLDNDADLDPFAHWDSDRYHVLTSALGPDDYSYVDRQSLIDHAIVTEAMTSTFGDDAVEVIYLDREMDDYTRYVSDHLPVMMRFDPSR